MAILERSVILDNFEHGIVVSAGWEGAVLEMADLLCYERTTVLSVLHTQ